jgi:hypothetical protein
VALALALREGEAQLQGVGEGEGVVEALVQRVGEPLLAAEALRLRDGEAEAERDAPGEDEAAALGEGGCEAGCVAEKLKLIDLPRAMESFGGATQEARSRALIKEIKSIAHPAARQELLRRPAGDLGNSPVFDAQIGSNGLPLFVLRDERRASDPKVPLHARGRHDRPEARPRSIR